MNLTKVRNIAEPGDLILVGGDGFIARLIRYGQKVQTADGKPSLWSHVMMYRNRETVLESTMDFEPFPARAPEDKSRRLDNGVQINYLAHYQSSSPSLVLHFPFGEVERSLLIKRGEELEREGYTYPVLGLVGSLLAFWIFRGWSSNPLQSRRSLYCSAFVQKVYREALGIDFDGAHTDRNTSPEIIYQFDYPGLEKIEVS